MYTTVDPALTFDSERPFFIYAANNPLRFVDRLGLIEVAPGEECEGLSDLLDELMPLIQSCMCDFFFQEVLQTDLPSLLENPEILVGTLPTRTSGSSAPAGKFSPDKPEQVRIEKKYCRKTNSDRKRKEGAQLLLHELAHWADYHNNEYLWHGVYEVGCGAEKFCFGFSYGDNPLEPCNKPPKKRLR